MSEDKFCSNYGKQPKFVDRYNSGELKVEKAGYQPAYKEIAQMIASGERFQKAREFQYKNEAEIDEKVNHVDTYDKDVFEMIDESRRLEASVLADIQASEKAKKDAEKQAIIDDIKAEMAAEAASKQTSEAQWWASRVSQTGIIVNLMSIMPVDTEVWGVKGMPIAMAIIQAIMAARSMKFSDDKVGSGFGMLGSLYNLYNTSSMFNVGPAYDNTLGDYGVRRNYL